MERGEVFESTLSFKDSTGVVQTLRIKWPTSVTSLLVVVTCIGRSTRLCFIRKNTVVNRLIWQSPRMKLSEVVVCGLARDRSADQEGNRGYEMYSVVGNHRITLDYLNAQIHTIDLNAHTPLLLERHLIHCLATQKTFPIEEKFEPSRSHSLKVTLPLENTGGMYCIYNERQRKEYLVVCFRQSPTSSVVPLLAIRQPRTTYRVLAVAFTGSEEYRFGERRVVASAHVTCGHSDILTVKSGNSLANLQELMDKAVSYCLQRKRSSARYTIEKFYRNKQSSYYNDIMDNKAGIMEKYIKDNNGDPYNPINHKINGLFFFASLEPGTGSPLSFSYFGDTRLFIPADQLITSDTRMYFADFWCHRITHNVTVVLTRRDSAEDVFCQSSLLELNLTDNPFFTVTERHASQISKPRQQSLGTHKTYSMISADYFHVEFLYTENVDIRYLAREPITGLGVSRKDGLPKNSFCQICNL